LAISRYTLDDLLGVPAGGDDAGQRISLLILYALLGRKSARSGTLPPEFAPSPAIADRTAPARDRR